MVSCGSGMIGSGRSLPSLARSEIAPQKPPAGGRFCRVMLVLDLAVRGVRVLELSRQTVSRQGETRCVERRHIDVPAGIAAEAGAIAWRSRASLQGRIHGVSAAPGCGDRGTREQR